MNNVQIKFYESTGKVAKLIFDRFDKVTSKNEGLNMSKKSQPNIVIEEITDNVNLKTK